METVVQPGLEGDPGLCPSPSSFQGIRLLKGRPGFPSPQRFGAGTEGERVQILPASQSPLCPRGVLSGGWNYSA